MRINRQMTIEYAKYTLGESGDSWAQAVKKVKSETVILLMWCADGTGYGSQPLNLTLGGYLMSLRVIRETLGRQLFAALADDRPHVAHRSNHRGSLILIRQHEDDDGGVFTVMVDQFIANKFSYDPKSIPTPALCEMAACALFDALMMAAPTGEA